MFEDDSNLKLGLQALGVIAGGAIMAWGFLVKHFKSDGKPPSERPPKTHEVRQAIEDMRKQAEARQMDEEMLNSLMKAMRALVAVCDRMAREVEKNTRGLEGNTEGALSVAREIPALRAAVVDMAKELEFQSRANGRR